MSYSGKHDYDQPIPDGWETFTLKFNLAGSNHRLDMVKTALEGNEDPNIFIKPEPDNEHDRNALMVMVNRKMFWMFNTDFHIGYLPKPLSEILYENRVQKKVKIRITRLNVHASGKVSIICEIMGPSGIYSDRLKEEIDHCDMQDY